MRDVWLELNLALRKGNFISCNRQDFGGANRKFDHKKCLPDKDPNSVGQDSKKSVVAIRKEFEIAESNFVIKNARSGVKEFATEM